MLQECLKGELRILNVHLPREQKQLSTLLAEETPSLVCNDGSTHLFKKKELKYLADILDNTEQVELLLPILIEVNPSQDEMAVISRGDIELKVISKILEMPLIIEQRKITIYKPQLAVLRKILKTTTQYVFSPRIIE